MKTKKIKTLGNHYALEVVDSGPVQEGGIYLSSEAEKELLVEAKVLCAPSVSRGVEISEGDIVLVYKPRGHWHKNILYVEEPFIVAILIESGSI